MFSALFCGNSIAFDSATVSQTWNARLGKRTEGMDLNALQCSTLQCRSKLLEGSKNALKYAFRDLKLKKQIWREGTRPI